MVPLATRNLLVEKGRLAMSIGGVAFAVLLILIVVSLYRGWSDVGRLYEQLPGRVWVAQRGTSDPFHSTSFLALRDTRVVSALPGVEAAIPVYARHIAFRRNGRELDVFTMALALPHGVRGSAARYVIPAGGIDVDQVLAADAGVRVGDGLDVLGRRLRVTRIHSGGNGIFQTAFMNAADARALFGVDGLVNFLLVAPRPGASEKRLADAIVQAVPGAETHTAAEFATSFANRVNSGFLAVVGVLVGIGLVVGGAVIALTTYTATTERAREYGVLKAIGASASFLYRVVVRQSLAVGLAGSLVGIGAAAASTRLIRRGVPEFITVLRWQDVAAVFLLALATAAVAAWVPARRIDRIDPAEVFRA